VNCTNCGAPLRVAGPGSYLYCRFCSSLFFPEESQDKIDVVGVESAQRCPVCQDTLVAATAADVPVLYCRRCHGVLINQALFAPLVKYLQAQTADPSAPLKPLNRDDLQRTLQCPQCERQMETHPYYGPGNIVIDVCMPCRLVWLDGGELNAISNATVWSNLSDSDQDNSD
jgi:Zn-finger nucleic acid-binding protein